MSIEKIQHYGLHYGKSLSQSMDPALVGLSDQQLDDLCGGFKVHSGELNNKHNQEREALEATLDPQRQALRDKQEAEQEEWRLRTRKKAFGCVRALADSLLEWYPRGSVAVTESPRGTVPPFDVRLVHYGPSKGVKITNGDLDPMAKT